MARVLIQRFCAFGLPNQIHLDNDSEFINQLRKELFQVLKILHNNTLPYIQDP